MAKAPGPSEHSALRAELMAAAVAAAHKHVLRHWLRWDATDPVHEIDLAMGQMVALFSSDCRPLAPVTV